MRCISKLFTVAVVSAFVGGVAACGQEEQVSVQPTTGAVTEATTEATEQPAETSTTTTDATAAPAESTNAARPSMSAADKKVLQDLYAFEMQAQKMVAVKADREVSAGFGKLVATIGSDAGVNIAALKKAADAGGVSLTAGSPSGLLSNDQVTNAGTPSGAEFEQAWRALMKDQRSAAAQYARGAKVTDAEVKKAAAAVAQKSAAHQSSL